LSLSAPGAISWSYSDHSSFSLTYLTDIMGRNGREFEDGVAFSYDYQFANH